MCLIIGSFGTECQRVPNLATYQTMRKGNGKRRALTYAVVHNYLWKHGHATNMAKEFNALLMRTKALRKLSPLRLILLRHLLTWCTPLRVRSQSFKDETDTDVLKTMQAAITDVRTSTATLIQHAYLKHLYHPVHPWHMQAFSHFASFIQTQNAINASSNHGTAANTTLLSVT